MFPENPGGKTLFGPQPGTMGCPGTFRNWNLMRGIRVLLYREQWNLFPSSSLLPFGHETVLFHPHCDLLPLHRLSSWDGSSGVGLL